MSLLFLFSPNIVVQPTSIIEEYTKIILSKNNINILLQPSVIGVLLLKNNDIIEL